MALFLEELWAISIEAAPYLLIGFAAAALLHRYVPSEWLVRLLGRGRFRSTAMAAALGAPLPLCSCSVVPTALAIRKKGAPRGATLAFFISTPETGVDSILLTYGLFGPVLAVIRPLAAVLSAFGAGLFLEALPDSDRVKARIASDPAVAAKPCCHQNSDSSAPAEIPQPIPVSSCCETAVTLQPPTCCAGAPEASKTWLPAPFRGLFDSFFTLFDEIAIWIAIGLALSALVAAFLPPEVFASSYGGGWKGMVLAILIGLPLYVCATASTPLAAVMVGKGFSAGAALVFLLVGPATNLGTITIVWRILGGWAIFAYLVSIVLVSVVFGVIVDAYFPEVGAGMAGLVGTHRHASSAFPEVLAIILWIMLVWRSGRNWVPGSAKKG